MKRKIVLLLSVLCLSCAGLRAAAVDTLIVRSASMNKDVKVLVIAPDRAKQKTGRGFPVLYLLHGYDGDHRSWLSIQPSLPAMAERDGIIVVCPDGENNWYWDSPKDPSSRYESFIARELPIYIGARYDAQADRTGRAITGLSMGGHGAMWLAMRNKEMFGAAGSTSGGLDIRPFPGNWNIAHFLGSKEDNEAVWDIYTAAGQIDNIADGDLALIIDCGYDDFFFAVNNEFHDKLLARKIGHDYIVRPGGHNVPYWRNALDYQWLFFRKFFAREQTR